VKKHTLSEVQRGSWETRLEMNQYCDRLRNGTGKHIEDVKSLEREGKSRHCPYNGKDETCRPRVDNLRFPFPQTYSFDAAMMA